MKSRKQATKGADAPQSLGTARGITKAELDTIINGRAGKALGRSARFTAEEVAECLDSIVTRIEEVLEVERLVTWVESEPNHPITVGLVLRGLENLIEMLNHDVWAAARRVTARGELADVRQLASYDAIINLNGDKPYQDLMAAQAAARAELGL